MIDIVSMEECHSLSDVTCYLAVENDLQHLEDIGSTEGSTFEIDCNGTVLHLSSGFQLENLPFSIRRTLVRFSDRTSGWECV